MIRAWQSFQRCSLKLTRGALLEQGCVVEVEGIVKGRLCFTVMDREGLHIARLGSADLNFAQLWIKVRPPAASTIARRRSLHPA